MWHQGHVPWAHSLGHTQPPACLSESKLPSRCSNKQEASELVLWFCSLWFAGDLFKVNSWYRSAKGPEQNVTSRSCEFFHLLLFLGYELLEIMLKFTAVSLEMSLVLALSQYFHQEAQRHDAATLTSYININDQFFSRVNKQCITDIKKTFFKVEILEWLCCQNWFQFKDTQQWYI